MILIDHYKRKTNGIPQLYALGIAQDKSRVIKEHAYITSNFSFILSGNGFVTENGVNYEITAPTVIFERNGVIQNYGPYSKWNEAYFIYNMDWETLALRWRLPVNGLYHWKMCGLPRVLTMLDEIRQMISTDNSWSNIDRVDRLTEMMVLESIYGDEYRVTETMYSNIHEIEKYITEHFCEQLSILSLAKQYGFSPATFRRHWNSAFSTPPHKFILNLKIYNAYRLLLSTDLPINEIAYDSGFSDPLYFTRLFSAYFGLSPSKIRKDNYVIKM